MYARDPSAVLRLKFGQQLFFRGTLDKRRHRHQHIGLRVGALFCQAFNNRPGTAFHVLHLDARCFGESGELVLVPAVITIVQAVSGVNRDDAICPYRRAGQREQGQQGKSGEFHRICLIG